MLVAAPVQAAAPCDSLRAELRERIEQDPAAAQDNGLLLKVLAPKEIAPLRPRRDCEEIRGWMEQAGLDAAAMETLKATDNEICYHTPELYDARGDGGFVALSATEGELHCYVVQIVLVDGRRTSLGSFSDSENCWSFDFAVLRQDGVAYPAFVEYREEGERLGRYLKFLPAGPDGADCAMAVTYRAVPRVEHWFGPKGEGDIDPELRRVIEPILLERALGHDAAALIAPLLDRSPDVPDSTDDPRGWMPFTDQQHENYAELPQSAITPLLINGRRVSLTFGTPVFGSRPWPDFGFALYELDGKDFQPLAGGFMTRTGVDPRIE